jgi:hypothetical protein
MENKDRIDQRVNEYRLQNRDKELKRIEAYRKSPHGQEMRKNYNNTPKARATKMRYKKSEHGRTVTRLSALRRNRRLKQHLVNILGGKCVECGIIDIRMLEIDHINGGGTSDRRQRGPAGVILYYIRNIEEAKEKLQVLCANHHRVKTYLGLGDNL